MNMKNLINIGNLKYIKEGEQVSLIGVLKKSQLFFKKKHEAESLIKIRMITLADYDNNEINLKLVNHVNFLNF